MRFHQKQANAQMISDTTGVHVHRAMDLEGKSNSLEIAEELGVTKNDIKKIKEKMNRS
ncbi:hypothetical protein [Aquibacillus sediminis]|uniref:hypothetical protein n=1 Tax=Aquibacillus sediminis TaxID=2574734 RepID=UPI001486A08B|nr:hypothetical protein [Aquibacillus sediminis]